MHQAGRKLGILICLTTLICATMAFGQATTGTISGTAMDQSGAAVAGATITARNLDTNISRTTTTGPDGRYSFPGLTTGRYEIRAEQTGFATYVRGPITLMLNQVAVVNPEFRPAAVAETVTVTEDAPLVNTTTAEVGTTFESKRLSELPLNTTRNVFTVALNAPGVSQINTGNSGFASGVNMSVNGMRLRSNNFMIDGQDINDVSVTGSVQPANNPDIVKEFRLVTNQPTAEFGRASGSVVNIITKSGTNQLHGSAFWFYNSNAFNSRTNLEEEANKLNPARFPKAPWRVENQFGGTIGGPIIKDRTFFFGSLQRWTDRFLGAGDVAITAAPTEAGRQILQTNFGTRPQVQALLAHLPAAEGAATGVRRVCSVGGAPTQSGGVWSCPDAAATLVEVPTGSLTGSLSPKFNSWQYTGRVDHHFGNHMLGGRFMISDSLSEGVGAQATPPGLAHVTPSKPINIMAYLTTPVTARLLNHLQLSYQRQHAFFTGVEAAPKTIPSVEITDLGLVGFNAAASRTAIGLGVNLDQGRTGNTYQIANTTTYNVGAHSLKFGLDFRQQRVKSLFVPTIRGRLQYATLHSFVQDIAAIATINKPLPGGAVFNYYQWEDYFLFVQDTWKVHPTFTLSYGLRYELHGQAIDSLASISASIKAANGGDPVFDLTPKPGRDTNNFQPRFGFNWNPRTSEDSMLGFLTGGDKLVVRGGYSRTNDYQFINIALNIATAFPFLGSITFPANQANAWTLLPAAQPDLTNPASLNMLTRTVVGEDFRSPIAEQFTFELQRSLGTNTVVRAGWVGTKGTALFQTIDGNPRVLCSQLPVTLGAGQDINNPNASYSISGACPRVDTTRGAIRLRANRASSIYHSLQTSVERRLSQGFSAGAHYTWSAFIDSASEIFNPSVAGEVAMAQNAWDPRAERGRSTYDRPHRLSVNGVYELPFYRNQEGAIGHILGGWQIAGATTFQSGSPFSPLNGTDPTGHTSGVNALVGVPTRPNYNTNLNVSKMTIPQIQAAGGAALFSPLTVTSTCVRPVGQLVCNVVAPFGNVGRNILRSDGIANLDLSIMKSTRITEGHRIQYRADFFNATNSRDFGIPNSFVTSTAFLNEKATNGGNRRIVMSLRYVF